MRQGSVVHGVVLYQQALVSGSTYLELLSCDEGKVKAIIRLKKKENRCLLGKSIDCEYTARQSQQVPFCVLQNVCEQHSYAALLHHPLPSLAWRAALDICRLISENEASSEVYKRLLCLRDAVMLCEENPWKSAYLSLELCILREVGYGMRIDQCAVTHKTEALRFISPKTGAAVTEEVGLPYAKRLLHYPEAFLKMRQSFLCPLSMEEFFDALGVLGFFLQKYIKRSLVREQIMLWAHA